MFSKQNANYMYNVVDSFIRGEMFQKNSMSCGNDGIYSYNKRIAFYHNGKIVLNKISYSRTTGNHQNVVDNVFNNLYDDIAWIRGESLSSDSMLYNPAMHNVSVIDSEEIQHYVAAAKLLKNRSHTAYAKKLLNMSHDAIDEHNKNVRHMERKRFFCVKLDSFIRGTTLKKTCHKFGERGSIGKIIGDKFYIFGTQNAGSLLKLKMMMSSDNIVEKTDLSTIGEARDWSDGVMRVTGTSKFGIRFNDQFISYKQLDKMFSRGDVSLKD